jgi:hypothetical protein
MADPRTSWEQVGDQISGLGLKLKLHFEQAAKESQVEEQDKIKEALRALGEAVDQAFTALGNAARDDAVREDARDIGRAMRDALDVSFSKLGEQFRSSVKGD